MAEWQEAETLIIWLAVGLGMMLTLIGAIVVFTRIYLNRKMADARTLSEMQLAHQKELLNDSIRVQEKERERIAQDIHDELIASLNIMVLLDNSDRQKSEELLQQSIQTARRISHDLSPPMLEEYSFSEFIEQLISPFQSEFEVDFFVSDTSLEPLPPATKLQLIRILQEILNNLLKYAQTPRIKLMLRFTPTLLSIILCDYGQGFDTQKAKKGLGLRNIEMRTQMLGGQFKLRSIIGEGTSYVFAFPLSNIKNDGRAN